MIAERSIYLYAPRMPPEREVRERVAALIAERRGTSGCARFAQTWILTCECGALTVTGDMGAPGKFRADHAACGRAA